MLGELDAFVRVVEAGSFTAAAARLGVPKSTVSRALSRLEESTKVRLLHRTTRALHLTTEGRELYARVAPHLEAVRDAARSLELRSDEPEGLLRITAPVDLGESLLAEVVPRFLARYPNVSVDVDLSSRVVSLPSEDIDVAIRATRAPHPSLVAKRIGAAELGLYASPAYLARRGSPRARADLSAHDVVAFQFRDSSPDARAAARRIPDEAARLVAHDFAFLRSTLRAGAGVGPLPVFFAWNDVVAGLLVRVLPEWAHQGGTLWFVYPSGPNPPRKVVAFRDFVLETARRLPLAPRPAPGSSGHGERGR
jgi:DNA-binding transcriptional LysR family regulator